MDDPMAKSGLRVLEKVELSDDEESEMSYNLVGEDLDLDEDNDGDDADDSDLADALAMMEGRGTDEGNFRGQNGSTNQANETITHVRPSVPDDFIRNFLSKAGMKRTLATFSTEWYELQNKGKLPATLVDTVPDIYLRNEELDVSSAALRQQVEQMREVAAKARSTWDKFRKERDFHRMHHKRVVQEKDKLLKDLSQLRKHLRGYEPTIEELKRRHETGMKDKMMIKLERDRLRSQVKVLEEQVRKLQEEQPADNRDKTQPKTQQRSATRAVRQHAEFPPRGSVKNPFLGLQFPPASFDQMVTRKTHKAHVSAISGCAFHPKKPTFATASDDGTWKLWTLPNCELVMTGEGHTSWLSGVDFHPHGSHLATSSGDGTVKVWEFAQAKCMYTFAEHTNSVWSAKFHHGGDHLASCSTDHTVRIWDLISGKCRQSLRGHVDSVNAIDWIPYSSNICTAAGDKTVSVWDARTGLCSQTLYGHTNACNGVSVSNNGHTVVSCDADGVLKVWDIRMVAELGTVETGQYPLNQALLDRGGRIVVAASDDATLKCIDLETFSVVGTLEGGGACVQSVAVNPNDSTVISGASDCMVTIWSV